MGSPALRLTTYAEYLDIEAEGTEKLGFKAGVVFGMAGGSLAHAQLVLHVGALLFNGLRGRPCVAYGSELKVRVDEVDAAYYADATVLCGPPVRARDDANAVTNPTLLVEVLSPSTEAFDRGEKFDDYALLPTLSEYLLVSTMRRVVEVWRRGVGGVWERHRAGAGEVVRLASIDLSFAVDDLYLGVELDTPVRRVEGGRLKGD